jgi:hypothetical protein
VVTIKWLPGNELHKVEIILIRSGSPWSPDDNNMILAALLQFLQQCR